MVHVAEYASSYNQLVCQQNLESKFPSRDGREEASIFHSRNIGSTSNHCRLVLRTSIQSLDTCRPDCFHDRVLHIAAHYRVTTSAPLHGSMLSPNFVYLDIRPNPSISTKAIFWPDLQGPIGVQPSNLWRESMRIAGERNSDLSS